MLMQWRFSEMKNLRVIALGFVLSCLVVDVCGQGARYIEKQLLCTLDRAPCDAWGQQIKAALPEIIGRRCENCDSVQINNVRRVARFIQSRYPGLWTAIVDKYSREDESPNPNEQ